MNSNSIRDAIIALKRENPHLTAPQIAAQLGTTVPYVWKVLSQARKGKGQGKGWRGGLGPPPEPLPKPALPPPKPPEVECHAIYYRDQGPTGWYRACPAPKGLNQNGQKVYSCESFSFQIWPSGVYMVWPYRGDWKDALKRWVSSWLDPEAAQLMVDGLCAENRTIHAAIHHPGIPTGYRIRIPGIGALETDKSPWKDGTLELKLNLSLEERIDAMERALHRMAEGLEAFAIQIERHLAVLEGIGARVGELGEVLADFRIAVNELREEMARMRDRGGN
ncbi:MAG: hypothetical protein QXQ76_03085 [Candidatus Bathyarchaeia archaeon]